MFTLLCSLVGGCPTDADAAKTPKLRFSEAIFDFGFMPDVLQVRHRFWVFNVGTDTLQIKSVKPTCGCTTVPLPRDRVLPGDSVPLEVAFDPKRFSGKVVKVVTILTNDPAAADTAIRFEAVITKPAGTIRAEPVAAYLDTLGKEQQVVTFVNTSDTTYKAGISSMVPDFLIVELAADSLPGKGNLRATIEPGPKTPIGEFRGSVTFRFKADVSQSVTVPIFGMGYYR